MMSRPSDSWSVGSFQNLQSHRHHRDNPDHQLDSLAHLRNSLVHLWDSLAQNPTAHLQIY